ncbi:MULTISPECIES: death-on-curing protein [Paenibacillus]|uniref:Death-on-curing protein n=1 Tax=Paenibacillus flagellatus TaxID=2211139 RepID=A0A2V5KK87_9BACL|nr:MULTISPECIES: death-on-curing protein [Paenibacillus]PYI50937.1 death-on-curing protein [Paenibacillus flagellatus]
MNAFSDKFALTRQQSVFLAKKKWDENIYCGMKMENRNITFPQTRTILNGVNVPGVTLDDIQAVLNMRDAWRYLVTTIDEPTTLTYICKLDVYVARNEALEWGVLRTGRIGIPGTDDVPPLTVSGEIEQELSVLLSADMTNTERAITAFLWGARRQMFWDGNKRTSLLLANKLLMEKGNGMLTITEKNMEKFNELLTAYYNTNDMRAIKVFLYEHAIDGIEFKEMEKSEPDRDR